MRVMTQTILFLRQCNAVLGTRCNFETDAVGIVEDILFESIDVAYTKRDAEVQWWLQATNAM